MNLHHHGYVVNDITAYAIKLKLQSPLLLVTDPIQNAHIALYKGLDKVYTELIQPLSDASPTWNFLQKKGEGFHHLCYECTESEMWEYAAAQRLIKVMGPVPAVLFDGRTVYFFVNRKSEVTEFLIH
jgi:methylmalonyl-CoA/ethylmalonyl-CoA epimerase